jgi:hypothetical protein
MGYHIYDWSARRCSIYRIIRITVVGYKDSNTSDGYILIKVLYIILCTPDRLLIIACWAYGLNPTILFRRCQPSEIGDTQELPF